MDFGRAVVLELMYRWVLKNISYPFSILSIKLICYAP